jgi:hypothetical protein
MHWLYASFNGRDLGSLGGWDDGIPYYGVEFLANSSWGILNVYELP